MKQLYSLQRISVSVFSVFLSLAALAGDPYRIAAGAAEAGTGYSCIMKNGFWSSFHNQALLAYSNGLSSGFNYENRFSIRELGTKTAGLAIPAGKASIGAIYSHFGYSDFSRQMAGLACGMSLSDEIAAGVQIDYFAERVAGEVNYDPAVTFEGGLLISPSENLRFGVHFFNPVPGSLRKRYLPSALRVGAGINLSRILFAGTEVEMSSGEKMNLKCGFEYEAGKRFWLRSGFSTENTAFGFGIGYLVNFVQIDLGFITHERLGVTSSASLIFKIK